MNLTFIVEVALHIPISKTFLYFYNTENYPLIGSRVLVNFNNNNIIGIVLSYKLYRNKKLDLKLKYVSYAIDNKSIFSKPIWNTMLKCSKYYSCSMNFIIFFGMPNFLKSISVLKFKQKYVWSITTYGKNIDIKLLKKCKKQISALHLLKRKDLFKTEYKKYNLSDYVFCELLKKKICKKKYIFYKYSYTNYFAKNFVIHIKNKNSYMKKIMYIIKSLKKFNVFLITNMLFYQKMKYYAILFSKILNSGLKVLLMVSNVFILNKIKQEIRGQIMFPIFSYHSKLPESHKFFCWKIFSKNDAILIISTKIGIFVPISNLGIIILDEENSTYYKVLGRWMFNVRSVAILRAYYEKIPIILESSEPDLNTLYNVYKNKIRSIVLSNKISDCYKNLKKVLININYERFRGVFSMSLINIIHTLLNKNKNVCFITDKMSYMFFFIKCINCNNILKCKICNQFCEYKIYENIIFCRFCFFRYNNFFRCIQCGRNKFCYSKCNTYFLTKNLKCVFPNIPVIFLEDKNIKDVTKFTSKCIFIVTQNCLYKYELKNIKVLVFLYIDYYFYFPYFRSIEILSQMYYSIIRLFLNFSNKPFTIIIQTKLCDKYLFKKFFYSGYSSFSKHLLNNRKDCQLPPFNSHAIIRLEGNSKTDISILLNYIIIFLKTSSFSSVKNFFFINSNYIYLEKYKKKFYSNILISHLNKYFLRKIFRKTFCKFKKFLYLKKISLIFDIDQIQIM